MCQSAAASRAVHYKAAAPQADTAPQICQPLAWLGAALGKFATLYLLVVQLICNVLPLKQPQIDMFTAMFSLPQLITALIGGGIAILIIPALKKAVK